MGPNELNSTVSDTTSQLNTSQEVVEAVQQLGEDTQDFFSNAWSYFQEALPTIVKVLLVALIGLLLAKVFLRLCKKALQRSKMDKSAHHFFYSVLRGAVYVVLVLVILQTLGVEMSSIVALFSVCGVALSLAVQGSLSNVCGGVLLALGGALNAFALGEEQAQHLGVSVRRVKLTVMAAVSVLLGVCVSIGGTIGFVGLVIPHMVRLVLGPDHRRLLPASLLAGAVFLLLADLVGRTLLSPIELPIGVVTSLVGAVAFLMIFYRSRKRGSA